jgi:hypothetical protein
MAKLVSADVTNFRVAGFSIDVGHGNDHTPAKHKWKED